MTPTRRSSSLWLLTSSLAAATGCSKSGGPDTAAEKLHLLTAHPWRQTAYTETTTSGGQPTTFDRYAAQQPCTHDDFIAFKPDNTFTQDEGPTKCVGTNPQTIPGTWSFASNATVLLFNPNTAGALDYQLKQLTATTLEMSITMVGSTGSTRVTHVAFAAM